MNQNRYKALNEVSGKSKRIQAEEDLSRGYVRETVSYFLFLFVF